MISKRGHSQLVVLICFLGTAQSVAATKRAGQGATGTTQATGSSQPQGTSIVYTNRKYRFKFTLPASWKGYSIIETKWVGDIYKQGDMQPSATQSGPLLSIRNPRWTDSEEYQDIPIMVFTHQQWKLVVEGKMNASGAAPVLPSQLGRNRRYVFALPPRYNDALPDGWEEVARIIQAQPLHPY